MSKIAQSLTAGVDEVGRGCWFGPVVACCVLVTAESLPKLQAIGVKDSKKLSEKQRLSLAITIKKLVASFRIGYATVAEIDQINILQASLLAMKRAVSKLPQPPELCLVDGKHLIPGLNLPQQNIIKGDSLSLAIAAASILAKVWRDELIVRMACLYPEYDLVHNKGYGTLKHRVALSQYGLSPQHRRSFRPCRELI